MRLWQRKLMTLFALLLLAGAAWQLGSAAYLHAKAWLAQQLIAHAWEHDDGSQRPWPWADMHPVARLTVRRTHDALYILSDATDRSLAFGPGVWQGSIDASHQSLVLAGHRDTHFSLLRLLAPGDELVLAHRSGEERRFAVKATRVLDTRSQSLGVASDAGELILVTCYPFDAVDPGGPLRYVVIAVPVRSDSRDRIVL